ncbi:hypothetical protein D7X88_03055 [bacterium C-53]|nr:hypothetical protein [Lachnospiraceae bacterium]NBI01998.1 hypothetical protein [Lachnospiraceae bacterium]RKJ12390.1 hypothetical protein D7X88_03055 [bacterium C-53]
MDCKEIESLIQPYIDHEMDNDYLCDFIGHIDHCKECRDELEIRFLIKEGLQSLERGERFDLSGELKERIRHSKRVAYLIRKVQLGIYFVEMVAGLFVTVCSVLLFL